MSRKITRILWIEDEIVSIADQMEKLESLNPDYEIDTEKNPEKALSQMLKNPSKYDVIIMDQLFSNSTMTGIEIANILFERQIRVCTILVTGKAKEFPNIYELVDSSVIYNFLEKPFTPHEVHFTIKRYEAEKTYEQKLALIQNISLTSIEGADLDTVLKHFVNDIHEIMQWPVCSIILKQQSGFLKVGAEFNLNENLANSFELSLGEGLVGYAIKHGKTLNLRDITKPHLAEGGLHIEMKYRIDFVKAELYSMLIVPIVSGDSILGSINVHKKGKSGFSEDDVQLMGIIASRVAIAILAADYFKTIIEAFNDIGREVNMLHEEEKMYDAIVEKMKKLLRANSGCILLKEENNNYLICKTSECPLIQNQLIDNVCRFPVESQNDSNNKLRLVTEVYKTRKGKYVGREEGYVVTTHAFPHAVEPTEYQMAVPLFDERKKKVLGILSVERNDEKFPFNDQQLRLFEALSNFIVTVINKNRLFEKEQRKSEILATLAHVASSIQNETNLIMLLQHILTGITVKEGLRFNRAAFFIYDSRKKLFKGMLGVGELDKSEAEHTWRRIAQEGKTYKNIISESPHVDELLKRPINTAIRDFSFSMSENHPIFKHLDCLVKEQKDIEKLELTPLYEIFQCEHFFISPIFVSQQLWGVIYTDKAFVYDRIITQEDQTLSKNFLLQIEEALQNYYNRRHSKLLAKIGETVNRNLDETQIYEKVVDIVQEAFNADSCSFLKIDNNGIVSVLKHPTLSGLHFDLHSGFVGWIMDNKEPLRTKIEYKNGSYYSDVGTAEWIQGHISPEECPYFLGVPIIQEGKVETVLCLRRHQMKFTSKEEDLLVEAATIISLAIRNAKSLKEIREWLEVINHITELNLSTLSASNFDSTLREIYERSLEIAKTEHGELFIFESEQKVLKANFYRDRLVDTIAYDKGVVGKCVIGKKLVNIPDVTTHEWVNTYLPLGGREQMRSVLAIPIFYKRGKQEELIGVINVESRRVNAFTDDIEKMLSTLANSAGIAIMNARNRQSSNKQLKSVERYRQIAKDVVSRQPLEKIYRKIADQSHRLLRKKGKFGVNLLILDDSKRNLISKGLKGDIKRYSIEEPISIENSFTGHVYNSGKSYRHGYVKNLRAKNRFVESKCFNFETSSELAVPIKYGDEILGVLNAESDQPYAFSEDDEKTFYFFAAQTGVAIKASRAFERMNDYLDAIAHKFKNHLQTFSSNIEILLEEYPIEDDEASHYLLNEIKSYKLDIENLSILSKIDSQAFEERKERFQLKRLLEELIQSYHKSLEIKNLKLDLVLSDNSRTVTTYHQTFKNILDNLISNAINYSYEATTIRIKVDSFKDHLVISIYNQGIGISESDKDKIFDKYYYITASQNIKRISPASGLGLYLVKRLVTFLDGDIDINTKVNQYAEFIITLPI